MRKTSLFAVGFSTVCLLLVSLVAHQKAVAFTMTDRATLAIVRPYPKIDELEAEACPGIPTSAVIDDDQSLNGKSVLLDKKTLKPTLTWKRSFERSTYALWCVARSDEKPTGYREPMYLHLIVNGPDGEQRYRMRVNYMHKMHQDIAHLYFDVNKPGEYTLTLSLGHDSAFNLQVDRLELRDVLAGTYKKGFKTQPMVYVDPAPIDESIRPFPRDEAMSRAKDIAEAFAPRNTIKTSGGMDKENFYKEFSLSRANFAEPTAGRWTWQINDNIEKPWAFRGPIPRQRDELDNMFDGLDGGGGEDMTAGLKVDDKLKTKSFGVTPKGSSKINWAKASVTDKGEYTAADYHAFKKAPSRWPDDGGGFFIPKDDFNLDHNLYFNWMAGGFKHRMVSIRSRIEDLADEYYRLGNEQAAFRAAVLLAHWADHFPSLDHTVQGTMNTTWGVYPFNTFSGRTVGEFGKMDYSGWAGDNNIGTVHAYDKLFRYIKHNQLLADAVGQSI